MHWPSSESGSTLPDGADDTEGELDVDGAIDDMTGAGTGLVGAGTGAGAGAGAGTGWGTGAGSVTTSVSPALSRLLERVFSLQMHARVVCSFFVSHFMNAW